MYQGDSDDGLQGSLTPLTVDEALALRLYRDPGEIRKPRPKRAVGKRK
jgi:hypothetical protein